MGGRLLTVTPCVISVVAPLLSVTRSFTATLPGVAYACVRVARGRGVVGHGLAGEGRVGRGGEGSHGWPVVDRDALGRVGRRSVVVGHAQLDRDGSRARVGLRRGRVRAGVGLKGAVPVEV